MTDRIAHRGPDAGGVWIHEDDRVSVHLGHRRLSIIDLSAAADQPMIKDGLVMVYNGELYNYRELRAELAGRGVRFVTNSDTEVVLEAWRCWGPKALPKFRGMFAFALADSRPASCSWPATRSASSRCSTSSGATARCSPPSSRRWSPRSGRSCGSSRARWSRRCSITGCPSSSARSRACASSRPAPGPRLRPDGDLQVEQYWKVADVARDAAAGPAPDLGRVIEESVTAHLVADVPVSSFLSGGLDSSIITVLAHRAAQEIDAYTITFRPEDQRLEAMPDDAIYARKVAAQFGVKLHEIEISPDIVDLLPRMVDALDEPIGDPAAINTLLMCQAARDRGVKVILSGMGADELFGGYRKHLACLMASRYGRLPGPARAGVRFAVDRTPVSVGGRGLRYARWAKRFLTFAELPEEPRFRRSYTLYDPDDLAGLLSPDLRGQVDRVVDGHRAIYTDNDLHDEVNRMCLADARLFLPGLNLSYSDRSSMAASVEVRVPFVDPVVAQAAFAIPGRDKIRNRQGKLALKRAAEAWLPKEIIYRPKASFSAPLRAWVRNDLREVINDVLVNGELTGAGMIRPAALNRLIEAERAGREDNAKQIWQLLSMELWYRNARSMGVAA